MKIERIELIVTCPRRNFFNTRASKTFFHKQIERSFDQLARTTFFASLSFRR